MILRNGNESKGEIMYYGNMPTIETYIYGYIIPPVALVTLLTNVLVCSVLLRHNMRSTTNYILSALAISDLICALFPMPLFIFLYTFGNVDDYLPMEWCYPDKALIVCASMFHTISIWLTVFLSVQRYIKICCQKTMAKVCSKKWTLVIVALLYIIGIGMQAVRLFENEYTAEVFPSKRLHGVNITGCRETVSAFVESAPYYKGINMGLRITFVKILPCICLATFTVLLIKSLQRAGKHRQKMVATIASANRDVKYATTTRVLVVITSVTLSVEFITSTDMIAALVRDAGGPCYSKETQVYINCFVHLIIVLSYPINFIAYCTMAKKFRDTIKHMFMGNKVK